MPDGMFYMFVPVPGCGKDERVFPTVDLRVACIFGSCPKDGCVCAKPIGSRPYLRTSLGGLEIVATLNLPSKS